MGFVSGVINGMKKEMHVPYIDCTRSGKGRLGVIVQACDLQTLLDFSMVF